MMRNDSYKLAWALRGCVRRSLFADNSGNPDNPGNLGMEAHLWQGLLIPAT